MLRNSPHTGGMGAIVNRPLARLVRGIAGFEVILLIDLYDVIFLPIGGLFCCNSFDGFSVVWLLASRGWR